MSNPPMRHLAAVMFTDLVGYTGLMQADEDAARAARSRHRKAVQEIVPMHRGRLVQFFGDGSLSLFSSSVSAVKAALEVQRVLQSEPALPLRIGIDEGEVAYDDQGVYGHCVNRSSRIQGVAEPGTVYISEKVYREVQNQSVFSARFAGEHQLKNVERPVTVYSIRDAALASKRAELNLLGGVSLKIQGEPVTGRSAQRRRLALLALLTGAPQGLMSRDKLVGYLWPDAEPTKARRLLSEALYVIRKTLGEDAVLATGEDLRLNADMVWSDVSAYREALQRDDLKAAVSYYAGPFLDGFFVDDALEFERWADGTRDRLAREYKKALRTLAEAADGQGDSTSAVQWWRSLIQDDPLDASVAVGYMESLEAAGQRSEALQFARKHAALFEEEFQAEPNPEVEALARRLRERPSRTGLTGGFEAAGPGPPEVAEGTRPEQWGLPTQPGLARSEGQPPVHAGPTTETEPPDHAERSSAGGGGGARRMRWGLVSAGGAAVVLVAGWATVTNGARGGANGTAGPVAQAVSPARVAILPFPAVQSSTELSGLWSLLSDYLADVGNVTSVPYVNVGARIDWRSGHTLAPDSAAELARAFSATHFTLGEMRQVDEATLSLSISLYETERPDGPIHRHFEEDSVGYQHRLVQNAAFALLEQLSPSPTELTGPGTESIEAYRAYKAGERDFLATDFESAISHFETAVEIDPEFVMAHYRLSQSLEWDEQYRRALTVADEAGSLAGVLGEHDGNLVLAWRDFLDGRADDAEERYVRILDRWDDDVEALYGLAKVLMFYNPIRGRSREEARPWLDRLLAVSPAFGDVMLHLMEFAATDGERARFDSLQSRVAGEGRMIRAWEYSEALSDGRPIDEVLPSVDDPVGEIGYPAAQLAMHWRQLDKAEALVDWYAERPEAMPRKDWLGVAYLLSGVFNVAQGQWSEGDDDTRRARDHARGWALELQAMQACLPGRSNRSEAAAAHAELEGWQFASNLDESLNELLLVHNGKHEALRTYLLGLTDTCRGESQEATSHLDEFGSGLLETTLELSLRAHIAYAEDDPDAALVHLDRIVQHPSVHELAASPFMSRPHDRYLRASILEERGDYEEAIGWYQGLTEMWDFSYLAPAHLGLARAHAALGRQADAVEHYRRAAALWHAGEPDALAFLGETRIAAGLGENAPAAPAGGDREVDQR
jgi:class 3 adenylate cyclase